MHQVRLLPRWLKQLSCVKLDGEYGLSDVFVGVPVKLGKNGVEKIIHINLTEEEQALLVQSAASVKEIMDVVDGMNIL